MRKFAAAMAAAGLLLLAACDDRQPTPIPVDPNHPGENPDCKYETRAGDCVPGAD